MCGVRKTCKDADTQREEHRVIMETERKVRQRQTKECQVLLASTIRKEEAKDY